MPSVCFYFHVHQPYRMAPYRVLDIGTDASYFDTKQNLDVLRKVAQKCYLPANALMLELIKKYPRKFKIAYSISGVVLEQFEQYAPEVLKSFKALAATGQVEFVAETYYHSLAAIFDPAEFTSQVKLHMRALRRHFQVTPHIFRNTELIYSNQIAELVEDLGFKAMLTEGADHVLGWRSPNHVYEPVNGRGMKLLLKNYKLSDDIAFRFSDQSWNEHPLSTKKFASWVHALNGSAETINLFMDYETFGEHQWEHTGIFDFMRNLPGEILKHKGFSFATPSEVIKKYKSVATLDIPTPISWADQERDISAWLGNPMQDGTAAWVYRLGKQVLATKDEDLIDRWRKLQTSDHFYFMCTKFWSDGDVHKYFSAHESPHQAYAFMGNILTDLEMLTEARAPRKRGRKPGSRAVRLSPTEAVPLAVATSPDLSPATAPPSTPVDGLRSRGVHVAPQVRRVGL